MLVAYAIAVPIVPLFAVPIVPLFAVPIVPLFARGLILSRSVGVFTVVGGFKSMLRIEGFFLRYLLYK